MISGTGPTYDYTWETRIDKFDLVWAVIVEEGVTAIGDMAFDNCKSMKSITLPKKVTMICDESFHWCDKLRTIKLLGKKHPKLESYCVFTTDTIFAKKRTKNITFKCPNMSKKEKNKFRKYLKKPYMYFYGKVK